MKFENYIWDFDGTLCDTYNFLTESLRSALKMNNVFVSFDEVYEKLRRTAVITIKEYSEIYGISEQKLHEDYLYYSHQFNFEKLKPFPHIIDVLQKIASEGGRNYIFTHRGKSIYPMLEYYDMTKYFVEIVESSSEYFKRKPDPYTLNYLTEKYAMNKDKTIYIGDREIDIECANSANILSCFYDEEKVCKNSTFNIKNYEEFINKYC